MVENFFCLCVRILEVIGDVTGMGYFLANIVSSKVCLPQQII